MRCMHAAQHVLFADEFIIVLLNLGVEAGVVIGIPRERCGAGGGGRAQDVFVDATDAARTGIERPGVVAFVGIGVTPAYEANPVKLLWCQHWIDAKYPQAS